MKTQTTLVDHRPPRIPASVQGKPNKVDIRIWELVQVTFNLISEFRVGHDPDFVLPGKVPGKVPGDCRLRTAVGTAGMTNQQYFHHLARPLAGSCDSSRGA